MPKGALKQFVISVNLQMLRLRDKRWRGCQSCRKCGNAQYLRACNGSSFMVGLMNHTNIDVHRRQSRDCKSAYSFSNHASIIKNGIAGIVHLGRSADIECQYHAALAFRKLAPNFDSHAPILDHDGLATLFLLTRLNDLKIQRQAATALRDLAADEDHKVKFVDEGGLDAMIELARDDNIGLRCLAMASLRHISL